MTDTPDPKTVLTDMRDLWIEDPDEFERQWAAMVKAGKLPLPAPKPEGK